jgi:hypothetical protein
MRIAILALASLIGGTASAAAQVQILSASPGRIEIAASCWWGGSYCQQEASDVAQGYCHGRFESSPRRAVLVQSGLVENRPTFIFRCDRQSIVCQAGNC